MAFDVYGTRGALGWSLERLNELRVYTDAAEPHTGYTTVLGGERFPTARQPSRPGAASAIGFEDLIAIEDFEFLEAVARGQPHEPGFEEALRVRRGAGRARALVGVRHAGRTSYALAEVAA